jgi:opacity protein-like surface antigen
MFYVICFLLNAKTITMKKLLLTVAALLICSAPAMADGPYVSLSGGLSMPNNSSGDLLGFTVDNAVTYKDGTAVEGAVGLKGQGYRVEAALGYQSSDVETLYIPNVNNSVSMTSYMANAYCDLMGDSVITPYVMLGAGATTISVEYLGYTADDTVFAYQAGAGVGLKASDNVTFDVGYRYFKPSNINAFGLSDVTFSSSNILAGVRIGF